MLSNQFFPPYALMAAVTASGIFQPLSYCQPRIQRLRQVHARDSSARRAVFNGFVQAWV
jgi:hypothetical protein